MFIALSALLAAVCFLPGAAKLGSHPRMQGAAGHFGIPWPRYRLIGVAELAAAAGVLIGLVWLPLGVAAALGMAMLLIGALVAHRRAGDGLAHAAPALVAFGVSIAYVATAV